VLRRRDQRRARDAALAIPIALAGAICIALFTPVRGVIERRVASREQQERERERSSRLDATAPLRREQYDALRDLVQDAERADPEQARRFGLEELLDDFVRIADLLERRQRATHIVGPPPSLRTPTGRTRVGAAADVVARRIQLNARCQRDRELLVSRIDSIEQLIRLIAFRIACPALDQDDEHAIARRLEDLDAVEAALDELDGGIDAPRQLAP
jgi:hypothetical protein